MQNTAQQFSEVINQCRDLFSKKLQDYGAAWRVLRPSSITDQIYIKVNRIRTLQMTDVKMVDEHEEDEFIAIVNYSIIGLIQLEKGLSNDFNENDYLYINQGNGTFKESSKDALTYMSRFSMGNDLADFNNDGWIDIMSLDMLPEDEIVQKMSAGEDSYEIYQLKLNFGYGRQTTRNSLQLNNANGTFSEIGQLAGVNATDWSWSPLFADFDFEGALGIVGF